MSKCPWNSRDIFFWGYVGIIFSTLATLSVKSPLALKMHYGKLYEKFIFLTIKNLRCYDEANQRQSSGKTCSR